MFFYISFSFHSNFHNNTHTHELVVKNRSDKTFKKGKKKSKKGKKKDVIFLLTRPERENEDGTVKFPTQKVFIFTL